MKGCVGETNRRALPAFSFTNYLQQTMSAHQCSEVIEFQALFYYV